jgi:hypothetical protein
MSVSITAAPAVHGGVHKLSLTQRFTAVMHVQEPRAAQRSTILQQLGLSSVCGAASTSTVYVPDAGNSPANGTHAGTLLQPALLPGRDTQLRGRYLLLGYDLQALAPGSLHAQEVQSRLMHNSPPETSSSRPISSLTSSVLGKGMHSGMLAWQVLPSPSSERDTNRLEIMCLQQLVPWYLQLWLHTLRVHVGNTVRGSLLRASRASTPGRCFTHLILFYCAYTGGVT